MPPFHLFRALALTAGSLLLAGPVVAQRVVEVRKFSDIRLLWDAFYAQCDLAEVQFVNTSSASMRGEGRWTRVEWTGGCAGNKLDGDGQFTVRTETRYTHTNSSIPPTQVSAVYRQTGHWVAGKPVGLFNARTEVQPGAPSEHWFFGDGSDASVYSRLPNGDFQQKSFTAPAATDAPVIPQKQMLDRSAQLIRAARGQGPAATVTVAAMADLLPGGQVTVAPGVSQVPDMARKSAGMLITTAGFAELDRHRRTLQAMRSQLDRIPFGDEAQRRDGLAMRQAYLDQYATDRMLVALKAELGRHFARVEPINDLAELTERKLDVAVVLDPTLLAAGNCSWNVRVLDARLHLLRAITALSAPRCPPIDDWTSPHGLFLLTAAEFSPAMQLRATLGSALDMLARP